MVIPHILQIASLRTLLSGTSLTIRMAMKFHLSIGNCPRARPIESQWDRIILLDHYIRRLGIRESVIAAEILKDDGDLANCIA